MRKPIYQNSNSFLGKTLIILVLLGIIPFLLGIYIFFYIRIDLTEIVLLFSTLALFSILTGFSLMRRSADQLVTLAIETGRIEAGEKSEPVQTKKDQEMNDIALHFNTVLKKMQAVERDNKEQGIQLMTYARDLSLSYRRVKEEEALRNRLSRYVGENLVEKLLHSGDGIFIKNERQEVTVLFADIRSFSTLAEKMPAEEVIEMLNQFFSAMVDIIFRNNGILDKFIGDQLMAVFGILSPNQSAPYNAVKAAMEMQEATEDLMNKRAKEGKETFEIGIGINTGSVIVGNVGSENRMDYTVIGDSVNVAARLQQTARGGEIIIDERSFGRTKDQFHIKEKGMLSVKNKTVPVVCYEVLTRHDLPI